MPAVVHHEHDSAAHAGFLKPPENPVQRNDGGQHSGKLIVHFQRHGHHESGAVLGADRQRVAAEYQGLQRRRKRSLQRLGHKGILVRLEIAGAAALGFLAHRGQVQNVWIAGDEVLEHPGHLRGVLGGVDLIDQAGERQNLAFADELLVEVGVELLNFFRQRSRHFRLLNALRIGQFSLAKLQNLTVIERQGQHADEQHGAQHQPENSGPVEKHRFEATEVHGRAGPITSILRSGQAGQKGGNLRCYALANGVDEKSTLV